MQRFRIPIFVLVAFSLTLAACDSDSEPRGELVTSDLVIGEGTEALPGHTLIVTFVGRLPDGTQFSHSDELGGEYIFTLGAGQVLDGWDEGLVGIRPGGTRRLEIPSHMAFGRQGLCLEGQSGETCSVPPNTDVVYDVTLDQIFQAVKVSDTTVGDGLEAEVGDLMFVEYIGTLPQYDDRVFGASYIDGSIFSFTLGQGQVIEGWDAGLQGMKEGGIRRLLIPPHLGYGAYGAGSQVPPFAVLEFEVTLLEVGKNPNN